MELGRENRPIQQKPSAAGKFTSPTGGLVVEGEKPDEEYSPGAPFK